MMPEPAFDPEPVSIGPVAGYNGPIAGPRAPHTPVGTPLLADMKPIAAPPANEPTKIRQTPRTITMRQRSPRQTKATAIRRIRPKPRSLERQTRQGRQGEGAP